MNIDLEKLKILAGIENEESVVTESETPPVQKIEFEQKPATVAELVGLPIENDLVKATEKTTGQEKLEAEKIKVPSQVKKAITTRIKELNDCLDTYGAGGTNETALDELKKFDELLSSGNVADYRQAQLLYGTLWTEIQERLPTLLVLFLHTGKEADKETIQ